ncbi:hypothetical protein SAMN05444166_4171 [Singulisphaera sp. GP187]|uniref:hypothetical protein n=1 Tax=Singulisphaera sp. GP187 TaxID=1882752 RepID=UPI00092B266B|nr:hypothetical protein [Singulisphaera sp. GP187]SIO37169.1 hypothetical protein SAMN05444166_4171 [Singulisphaera sp. GP187]
MAKRVKPRFYFEPWTAKKDPFLGPHPFPDGMPTNYPEGVAESIVDSWQRLDQGADWVIWGSRMADEPLVIKRCRNGETRVWTDQRIITINRALGLPEGSPNQEQISKRIVDCVNALAGVADPVAFMESVRSLLMGYARGEFDDPREDSKVFLLLGQCIPPAELEKLKDGNSNELQD